MLALKKVALGIDRALKSVIILLVVIMMIVGIMQIVFRYVLKSSLAWSEELIRYCFVWTTFLCVPVGIHEGRHVAIDLLKNMVPHKYIRYYNSIIYIIEVLVFVVLVYFGYTFAMKNTTQLSAAMKLPMVYVISAIPVSGILGIFYVITQIAIFDRESKL